MGFYKKNRNNDNYRGQLSEKKGTRFQVSDKSFQSATVVSSLTITIFAFILFIIKKNFSISESDIQSISGITAGLCGFALAIPLFLKDFDITSNFWKQFYLIAITFLVATFIGVISFLQIDTLSSISVTLWFFLSIVISVNISNVNFLWNKTRFKISLNPILSLSISYLALFLSLFFYKGDFWISATVLFTVYGFYLTLTLMLAILVELFFVNKKTEDNETRIKKAIQYLVEKYKEKALDEQTLLDKLKSEKFPNEQEIISRTKVQELVAEMDFESADNEPKITVYGYDKIIPRWKNEYERNVSNFPKFIFLKILTPYPIHSFEYFDIHYIRTEEEKKNIINNIVFGKDNRIFEEILEKLSEKTNLSKELLRENNLLSREYKLVLGGTEQKLSNRRYHSDYYNAFFFLTTIPQPRYFSYKDSEFLKDFGEYSNISFEYFTEIISQKMDLIKEIKLNEM